MDGVVVSPCGPYVRTVVVVMMDSELRVWYTEGGGSAGVACRGSSFGVGSVSLSSASSMSAQSRLLSVGLGLGPSLFVVSST